MTTGDVLRAMLTRWYATLICFALTAVIVLWVHSQPGVYTTQVDVQLVPPQEPITGVTKDDLIALAGVVEREIGDGTDREEPTSSEVTLAGLGVVEGISVTLPNSGGQWSHFFNHPLLRVQAVSRSADRAAEHREGAVARITAVLERIQVDSGALPGSLATVRLVPAQPQVAYEDGRKLRAMATTGLLGMALSLTAVVLVDRFMSHGSRLPWRRRRDVPATSA